tara:strand:+ start:892 stop:1017 length:126 start_codon:yes stop_codon:yes gene_type:complete
MFGAKKTVYKYFALSDYLKERITDYDGKNTLLNEWITLDQG